MSLVTAKEVAKAINADKYGVFGTFAGWMLMKVLKISTLNKIYDRNKHLSDLEFLNAILDEFQIKFEIPEEDFKDLLQDAQLNGKLEFVNEPIGDDQHEQSGIFKEIFVDQWTTNMEGDSFAGFIYGKLKENKWLKVPYYC